MSNTHEYESFESVAATAARLSEPATEALREAVRNYAGNVRRGSRGRRFDLALNDLAAARQRAFQAHTEPSDIPVSMDFMAGWEAARWYLEGRSYSSDETIREFLHLHDLNEIGEYEDDDE